MSQGIVSVSAVSLEAPVLGRAAQRDGSAYWRIRMLTRLLSRGARREQEAADAVAQAEAPAAPEVASKDSPLLFVPVDGGMSFRLFAVKNQAEAAAFLQEAFPGLGGKTLFFTPLRDGMRAAPGEQVEVLVVINDTSRPGTVYVSSFTDSESAESFVQFETDGGLDRNLVSVHRGIVESVNTGSPTGPYSTPVEPRPVATAAAAIPEAVNTVAIEPPAPAPVAPAQKPASIQPAVTTHKAAIPVAKPRATAATQAQPQAPAGPRQGLIDSIKTWPGWDTLPERINAAATLKWAEYEEMKGDPIAVSQSRVMVATAAAAGGVGALWAGPIAVVFYAAAGLLGWLAAAYLTYWVGTIFFPGRKDPENKELLFKTLGVCQAPRVILLIGLVLPIIGIVIPVMSVLLPLIVLAVLIWVLVAMIPATEYSLEIDRESATLTVLTSWLALFAVSFVIPAVIV
jgi:hypothetical protein